ncbi:ferredoxin [Kitasatospora sp. NPDC094019]|uniref:ferredoxin n=1 Tax=Kitasatospora sp. NPDC094019 TaxID=3364091 RepID=UPI0037F21DDF
MQVSVDRDRCCSSGLCVINAPAVFGQDDRDSLVTLRQVVLLPEQFEDVRLASELCPGQAITLTGDEPARTGA